jgi:hypothetical protein
VKEQIMNGTHEEVDIQTPPAAPPDTPPAAPQAAQTRPGGYAAAPPASHGQAARLPRKSPFLAGVLSLMPGLGQIYVGYYKLGFIHNVIFSSTIAFLATSRMFNPLIPVMGIFLAFFVVYNIIDAGRRAVYYNLAIDGVDGIDLPDMNISLPTFGGSIGGGVALLAVGFIFLLNTRFGVSLAWVEEWWPVALMGLGGYLLVKAVQERQAAAPSADDDAGTLFNDGSGSAPAD